MIFFYKEKKIKLVGKGKGKKIGKKRKGEEQKWKRGRKKRKWETYEFQKKCVSSPLFFV